MTRPYGFRDTERHHPDDEEAPRVRKAGKIMMLANPIENRLT
jgi:hypothetical protein